MKNAYVNRVWEEVKAKNANEPEFLQAVEEVLTTLDPVVAKMPDLNQTQFWNAWLNQSALFSSEYLGWTTRVSTM